MPLVKNNKNFLIVEIYPAIGSPSKFNKIPYIRVGKNKTELSRHKELEMKLWKSFESGIFWKKVIRSELNDSEVLELLDYDSYYSLIKIPRPTQFSEICSRFEEEEFIKKNVGSWGITNLGAILFAKDLSKFSNLKFKTPRVITYDGDHKLSQAIKDIYGIKGYACGFEDLIKWIYSQIPEPEKIGDIYRDTKVTYPEKAIRELVANSLIHQDCETDGARPTIEIYKNRIEISNPGNSLVPASEIIQSIPKSRNEMMSDVMRRLYICEKRGSGIDRSIQAIEDLQLPGIKFENFEVSFLSIIYSHKDYETLSTEEKLLACEQHVILSYIKQEYANNESLRKRFGIPKNKNYVISKLVKLAKDKMLINNADPDNYSRKHVRYIPIKG